MEFDLVIMNIVLILLQCLTLAVSGSEYYFIISFHGFRWDYMDQIKARGHMTPNFDAMKESGVKAEYLQNAFVTLSRPNHWSVATGMHVESHGIVSDHFYDPTSNDFFNDSTRDEPRWYKDIEPFWVTYQKASEDHHSAVVGWPGSSVEINGIAPTYSIPESSNMTSRNKVDQIVKWFTSSKKPAHLALLYVEEPGRTGSKHGLGSTELIDAILDLDAFLGYVIQTLRDNQLLLVTNLILLGDHGMTDLIETYRLADYVDPERYVLSGDSPNPMFLPREGDEESVYESLQLIPNAKVFRKEELPDHLHYRYHERIMPLVVMMVVGYGTCCYDGSQPENYKGAHGYDNNLPNMWPFFMAQGPVFRSNYVSPAFNNTDIYPLMCHLLGLETHPNNGSLDNIKHILSDYRPIPPTNIPDLTHLTKLFSTAIITFVIMFVLSCVVATCYFYVLRKSEPRNSRSLCVDIPDSHPSYKMSRMDGDRQWLLKNNGNDSESDIEEWQPLRTRQNSVQTTGDNEQEQAQTFL